MDKSFIKIYRSLDKWEWYRNSKMVHIFIHLLIKANFKEGRFEGEIIKRGQLATGIKSLYEQTNISFQSIRTCLIKLQKTKEITIRATNHFSIITLCNYETYQSNQQAEQQTDNKPITNGQQTDNKPITTIEEVKNVNNEKNEKKLDNEKELKNSFTFIADNGKAFNLSPEKVLKYLEQFISEQKAADSFNDRELKDLKSHFPKWLKKEILKPQLKKEIQYPKVGADGKYIKA